MHQLVIAIGLSDELFRCTTQTPSAVLHFAGEFPTFGDYFRTLDGFITATGDKAQPGTPAYRVVRPQHPRPIFAAPLYVWVCSSAGSLLC